MVTLAITDAKSAIDVYGLKLSQQLNVPTLSLGSREPFGTKTLSGEAARSLVRDFRRIRILGHHEGTLHLAHQHLGRYVSFVKVAYIITVHDLIRQLDRLGYPTLIHKPNLRDRAYLWLDWKGIEKARHIIAISGKTKRDLINYMNIPEERISVIYNGIDHKVFKPCSSPKPLDDPYVLCVGSEQPRKNLPLLLQAFRRFKADKGIEDLKLVKVGNPGGKGFRQQTLKLIERFNLGRDVRFTGFISEKELSGYYSNAQCLVFPSLYEGFGLPVVEAMACGCPVITSNTSSLPEIIGDAGIIVDPQDIDGLEEAMREVLTNQDLQEELRRRGIKQASRFSWEKTAEETMKVYKEVEQQLEGENRVNALA